MTAKDLNTAVQEVEKKINANKRNISFIEAIVKKSNKFDASYFTGKNYFDNDGTQNYLVFQQVYKYFKMTGNDVTSWESKELSSEKITFSGPATTYNKAPNLVYGNARIKLKFNRGCLKQNKIRYNHGPIVNIYIVYRLRPVINALGFNLENCLFGAVKVIKNADTDK